MIGSLGSGGVGGFDNELDEARKKQTCTECQNSEKHFTAMQPAVMQKLESQANINLQRNEAQRNSDQLMTEDKNTMAVYLNNYLSTPMDVVDRMSIQTKWSAPMDVVDISTPMNI